MVCVLTHRGLDPSRSPYFLESSFEAFEDQLKRGFGLEFDVQFTKDERIIVSHDQTLLRISDGTDKRRIDELTLSEILPLTFNDCRLASLQELLASISLYGSTPDQWFAVHVKHWWQSEHYLDLLIAELAAIDYRHFFIFDVTPISARYLKRRNSRLQLGASLAHPFDIQRYNASVGGTLIDIDTVLAHKEFFNWAWLDEWDRAGENGGKKSFYVQKVFDALRKAEMRIGVVSPELHATSPSLLGGEQHEDAQNMQALERRWSEIVALRPDGICTDYPDRVYALCQ